MNLGLCNLPSKCVAILGFCLALYGCSTVPLVQISKFGEVTSSVASDAAEAYKAFDDASIEREIYRIAFDTTLQPVDTTFDRILEKNGRWGTRMALLEQLGLYGRALQSIASADVQEQIDEASLSVYSALIGLDTTLQWAAKGQRIGKARIGIIATGIQALASAGIQKKKQESLKVIVMHADSGVQLASGLLSQEFHMLGRFVTTGQKDIEATLNDLYFTVKSNESYNQRVELLRALAVQHQLVVVAATIFEQLGECITQVGDIHTKIRSAMEQDEFSSATLAVEIGSLVKSAEKSKKFLGSLK